MPPELDNHSMTKPMSAPKPCVSVIGATTFGKLRRRLSAEEIEGGFANRFMYFVGERKPPKPLPPKPNQNLLNITKTTLHDTTTKWNHTEFKLSEEAFKVWDDFYCSEYSTDYDSITLDDIMARLMTHAMKIALVYAATENEEPVIKTEQMQAAIEVAEYLKQSAFKIFALQGSTKAERIEELIGNFLQENDSATKTDIYRHVKSSIFGISTKDVKFNLDNMMAMDLIFSREENYKDSMGRTRKKEVWKLKSD
jgi:hypothetical protein